MTNQRENDVCIIDAVRSPMGKRGGSMSEMVAANIPIQLVEGLFKRNPTMYEHAAEIEDVVIGCCSPLGGAALDIGRIVALGAQKEEDGKKVPLLPVTVPGMHLNRHCASGQTGLQVASMGIWSGMGEIYIAGGVEQQSKYPIGIDAEVGTPPVKIPKYKESKDTPGLYRKTRKEKEYFERKLALPPNGVLENYSSFSSQLISADRIAQTWKIERSELDQIGWWSQFKATKAMREGKFKDEIIPINTKTKEKGKFVYDFDEVIRTKIADMGEQAGVEKMGTLKTVPGCKAMTAGNSCPTNDGSSLMLLASRRKANELGLKIRARILTYGVVGSDIYHMLTGPAYAMDKALKRADLQLKDMAHMEVNEAFSSVTIACGKILADELGHDKSQCDFSVAGEFGEGGRVNPLGGAIALGHPTGASGCRLPTTMLYEMERKKQSYGLASLCVGFGMGTCVVIERE